MFGWEFPPYNSGGLGTACYGLTRALSSCGVDVTFVLPKYHPNLNCDFLNLVFADMKMIGVKSLLVGYMTSEEYYREKTVFGNTTLSSVVNTPGPAMIPGYKVVFLFNLISNIVIFPKIELTAWLESAVDG